MPRRSRAAAWGQTLPFLGDVADSWTRASEPPPESRPPEPRPPFVWKLGYFSTRDGGGPQSDAVAVGQQGSRGVVTQRLHAAAVEAPLQPLTLARRPTQAHLQQQSA